MVCSKMLSNNERLHDLIDEKKSIEYIAIFKVHHGLIDISDPLSHSLQLVFILTKMCVST